MIQNIKKIKFFIISLIVFFISSSCKEEGNEANAQLVVEDGSVLEVVSDGVLDSNYQGYEFYTTYFQSGGETDLPEVSEEEIVEKFRKVKLLMSKDTIAINDVKSYYNIEQLDSKKFFGKEYLYKYNISLYKNFFNVDLKNKVTFLSLDINNNDISPFVDYFLEAGDAVYENDCLFLNYKRYVICFRKVDKTKVYDKKLSQLPFDFERVYRLCQRDNRSMYENLCNNEYPINTFKSNSDLFEKIKIKLGKKIPLYYYDLNINSEKNKVIVVVTEAEEESYGDQFVLSLKGNEIIQVLSNDSDDFFHSRNFNVNKDLTINFFENNGLHPKDKIVYNYKINPDGTFKKI
jgi:hypothetical protein